MYDIRQDGNWEMAEGTVMDVEQTKIRAQAHFEKLDGIL